jgi:hypothetical protein
MRKLALFLFLTAFSGTVISIKAQDDLQQLINNLISSDWQTVKNAKLQLENYEGRAIPMIIKLLDRDEMVKLTGTGTLIYPGATKFYGYGQMIEYDIDRLAVRAGWLLEDITFNNFGFSGCHLAPEDQLTFIKITFPDYYNNANNRKKLENSTVSEISDIIFNLSVKRAKEWWAKEGNNFSRLTALVDALQSFDEKRQVKALFYLRYGETKCTGLTKEYYFENISKEIVRLSASETLRVSEHASNILSDTRFLWLESKNHE